MCTSLMKNKFVVCAKFIVYKNKVENEMNRKDKNNQFNRGGEYFGQELQQHLKDNRIISPVTPPNTSQHNCLSK